MPRSVRMTLTVAALLGALSGCEGPVAPRGDPVAALVAAVGDDGGGSEALEIGADLARSGTVTSWLAVQRSPSRVTVGEAGSGWLGIHHRAILSFDTSVLPDDATAVGLLLAFPVDADGLPPDYAVYFAEHLRAEIAPAGGFGGSAELSYRDYSAPAAASAAFEYNPAIGYPIMPPEVVAQLDPRGPTQIRLAFDANPEGLLAAFPLAEAGLEPSIVVVYTTSPSEACPGGEPPPCEPEERWVREPADFGSPSPYGAYSFAMRRFAGPAGTTAVRVSFSSFETEAGRDVVTLRDDRWAAVRAYSGGLGPFVSDPVSGSSVTVVFQADGAGSAAGFRLDAVEYRVE